MKRIKQIGALLFLVIIQACNNDDDTVTLEVLNIKYEQSTFEIGFLEEGQTLVPVVDWLGEKGTFSASSLTSDEVDLVDSSVFIDSETGVLSWNNFLPLGESKITISASNQFGIGMTEITINNEFNGRFGFFTGGFNNDTSDDPFISGFDNDVLLQLRNDGIVTLLSEFDSTVIGDGLWASEGNEIIVVYTHIDYPGEDLVMKGVLVHEINSDPPIVFSGLWGKGLDENDNMEELMGAFSFNDSL
ncbi:hypothetical protein [Aquimarina litoralis]|uniref:hypothetical protein n=1 Tax=Aquimarina litoralis TaxID=584605 RepID=UPI001C59ECA1|nr:hypothetical protein [Aquimarina litoralis]MBW1298882.1 hypothetical protein [Aquimarina litoralis]